MRDRRFFLQSPGGGMGLLVLIAMLGAAWLIFSV